MTIRRRRKSLTSQIERSAEAIIEKPRVEFISTGSINLNLAASQKGVNGGWARGRIINIVGDKSTGKTLLALEAAFWAYQNMMSNKSETFSRVKKVNITYDNIEGVMDFPLEKMYGKDFVEAVDWRQSETCEAFGRNYQRKVSDLKKGEFLLYILDSIDSTTSEAQQQRIDDKVNGKKMESGTYGTEKAKYFSNEFFNDLCRRMRNKDATLICISQVRENLNAGKFGKKYYRTGGKALDFYPHQVVWLYTMEKLKKSFRSQERIYGVRVRANFDKNKAAKPYRQAEFMIHFDYGLDDIWSMLDYLYVKSPTKKIKWIDEQEYKREDLISLIEENPEQYKKLIEMTEEDWNEIERKISPKRKRRF